jgi:hypothetical protein
MKTRLALLFASALILSTSSLLAQSGVPKRGDKQAHNPPRANQGRIPKAPPARSNPVEKRQTEHLPTGHVNDIPHVNHDKWFGHEAPNDARFHLDHPFPQGHFAHFGPTFRYEVNRIDVNLHRFWFPGGFFFEVAPADWPLCEEWCWDCGDDFVVYEDSDHTGWYLLYNVHTGVYVHVQYMGT